VNIRPELAKSGSWNVRKPEGEEHRVTFGIWLPIEEIIYDVVDIGASTRAWLRASASGELSTTGRRSAVRARRSVHQPVPPASSNTEPLAPKEAGRRPRPLLGAAIRQLFLAPVMTAPSLPPFVILGRSRPIVRALLG
jgi:hypothetical protein